jgi:hypothetical protein
MTCKDCDCKKVSRIDVISQNGNNGEHYVDELTKEAQALELYGDFDPFCVQCKNHSTSLCEECEMLEHHGITVPLHYAKDIKE